MWSIAAQEEQDIFFWFFWKFGWFATVFLTFLLGLFCLFLKTPEVIVLTFGLCCLFLFFGGFVFAQQQVIIYVFLDREDGIQETLDFQFAMFELVFGDAFGVNTHLVNHAARGVLEVGVVFEEVGMTEDVCCHERILQQVVHLHQEGIARVGVDHHLIDFAQPEVIHHFLPVVSFPMRPV